MENIIWYHEKDKYCMVSLKKLMETENRKVVARGWGLGAPGEAGKRYRCSAKDE